MNREALANRCIDRLHKNGHQLFNCHCGRIHVGPMGIVNPEGWEARAMVRGVIIGIVAFLLLMTGVVIYGNSLLA